MIRDSISNLPEPIKIKTKYLVNQDKLKVWKCESLMELYQEHMRNALVFDLAQIMLDENTPKVSYAVGYILYFDSNGILTGDAGVFYYEIQNGNEYMDFVTKYKKYKETKDEKIWWMSN